jgi:hypothetical protein
MSDGSGDVVSVFRIAPSATNADITALTTAIRTTADLTGVFPNEWQKAIVARGTPEKIAAADWMVHQVLPADGETPTEDSPAYPMEPLRPDKSDGSSVIRVFRMDPKTTNAELTSMVTAIRSTADLQRLFPFDTGKAVIARGSPAQVAVGEWLIHELAKPADADANAVHQTTMPGLIDGVIRLFFVGQETSSADLTALVSQIRTTAGVMRIFPFTQPSAVVVRGRPDQMSTAELLVGRFEAKAQ